LFFSDRAGLKGNAGQGLNRQGLPYGKSFALLVFQKPHVSAPLFVHGLIAPGENTSFFALYFVFLRWADFCPGNGMVLSSFIVPFGFKGNTGYFCYSL
jgi:hypothetical protein